jgi:hypothetical protein
MVRDTAGRASPLISKLPCTAPYRTAPHHHESILTPLYACLCYLLVLLDHDLLEQGMDTQHRESILSEEYAIHELNCDVHRERHIYEKHVAAARVSKRKIDAHEKESKLYQTSLSEVQILRTKHHQQMLISKDMVSGCTPYAVSIVRF